MKNDQSEVNRIDELDDIRAEYKEAKKKLEKYDTFVDNNQIALVFLFVLLAFGGVVTTSIVDFGQLAKSGLFYASISLFPIGIVFALVSGVRQSNKKRLEQKIEKLRREVMLFQKHSGNTQVQGHISRDELGLYEDIQAEQSSKRVVVGVVVTGLVLLAVIVPVVIAQGNNAREDAMRKEEQAKQEQYRQESRDRYYQQQQDALNLEQNQPTRCISTGSGSTVFTNCY